MDRKAMMTPSNAEAIIAFLFYCLAVHATVNDRDTTRSMIAGRLRGTADCTRKWLMMS
jgi:hypothetical protein